MLADFLAQTGWRVVVTYVDVTKLVSEVIWSGKNAPLTYDGWMADSSSVVDIIAQTDLLAPIERFLLEDATMDWPDVTQYVREISSTYAGRVMGVPTSSIPVVTYYRKDVLAKAGLDPPVTWDDLLVAAERLNGTDFNGDGEGDYALCFQLNVECSSAQFMPAAVLATMTQTAGPRTGFLFDPQTMQSFVGSAAMEATLEVIQGLVRYSAVGSTCDQLEPHMMNGTCAVLIAATTLFKLVQTLSPYKGVIGVARPPGSTHVLDRQTSRMEECTSELCPYAELQHMYNGHTMLVNHAPYWGASGFSGYINAIQDPVYQEATYAFYSFISEPKYSKQRVITQLLTGPFRTSHLDTSAASLREWESVGFDPSAVKELLFTIQSDMEHLNFVLKLRIRGGQDFLAVLAPAVGNITRGMAPAAVASNLAAVYDVILAESGPIDVVRASLWAGLGIEPPMPPPPLPSPPGAASDNSSSSRSNLSVILGVTISVIAVLLLLLAVYFLVMRHSKRSLFGRPWMPSANEETTLCVTDIMDSTALWETLDASGMSRAIATHHAIVRKALARFHGYEQATEGDSFLLAFHTPSDALGFAMQLQAGLLSADWEPELLAQLSCAPVAMTLSDALVDAGGGDDRFHLRAAANLLLGHSEDISVRWRRANSSVGFHGSYGSALHSSAAAPGPSYASHISSLMTGMLSPVAPTLLGTMGTAGVGGMTAVAALLAAGEISGGASYSANAVHEGVGKVVTTPPPHEAAPVVRGTAAYTMADFMRQAYTRTPHKDQTAMVVFKGLRVRVGMHSGAIKTDVEWNSTAGRRFFTGAPLALAKAVGDAGAGGMVLLTHDAFERLRPHRALNDVLMLCMGDHRFKNDSLAPVCLYQAIARPLVPRLAVFESLRDLETLQAGGYLVELTSSGLCLAAFREPASAVAWGMCLIEVMKHAAWDEELLAHELCEEVLVPTPGACGPFPERGTVPAERVLFRGPRLKVGIDEGPVQADVSPVTGRMTYRGRVMNRAARICGKVSCGMQWCSVAAWEHASRKVLEQLPSLGIVGTELGAFTLKGITGDVQLVQCALGGGSTLLATVHSVARVSMAHALGARAVADGVGEFSVEQSPAQSPAKAQGLPPWRRSMADNRDNCAWYWAAENLEIYPERL
ncbi:hypothetical protein FOA52_000071 [Chlamydomonas sp. UWO 241]|nr:hypothetical protein FOA52_000071 [Chlamydomonas sp. UWO 241]